MVTSPHELASWAGLEVLRDGGNAVEAAIAVGVTLSVTYPHFSGLGGDAFMMIADQHGDVMTSSGIGQAAENIPDYRGEPACPRAGVCADRSGNRGCVGSSLRAQSRILGRSDTLGTLVRVCDPTCSRGLPRDRVPKLLAAIQERGG